MRLPMKSDALDTSENKPASPVTGEVTVNRDPSYPDRKRIDSDVRAFLRPVSSPWIVFDRDSRCDDFAKSALRVGAVFSSSPSLLTPEPMSFEPPPVLDFGEPMKKISLRETSPVIIGELPEPAIDAIYAAARKSEQDAAQETPAAVEVAKAEVIKAEEPLEPLDPIRAGVVLSSAMNSIVEASTNMFPMFPTSSVPAEPNSEPSNLVVASDVIDSSMPMPAFNFDHSSIPSNPSDPFIVAPSFFAGKSRIMAIAGAACGVIALVGLTSVALSRSEVKSAAATTQSMQAMQAPVVQQQRDEIPAVAMAAQPSGPTIEIDNAPVAPPTATTEQPAVDPSTKMPLDPKKRFGKLTIKADAKHKNVWFDGKRMLGSGQRTFMVFCGMHTIAVAEKTETKDVEIPCNGEYTVSH